MMFSRRNLLTLGLLDLISPISMAESGPQGLIKFIVPLHYSGGWPRLVIQRLQEQLATPSIIEDKHGANGTIAMRYLLEQPTDKPTVLLSSVSTSTLNFLTRNDFGNDRKKIFKSVGMLFKLPMVLIGNASTPNNMGDFIKYCKVKSGGLNYSSNGIGSYPHLHSLLMGEIFGFDAVHVPQSGSTLIQVMSNTVDFAFVNFDSVLPFINNPKLRILATTSNTRSPLLPNVPTISEFEKTFVTWSNMSLQVNQYFDSELTEKLNLELNGMLSDNNWKKEAAKFGASLPTPHSPKDCDQWLDQEYVEWSKLVKKINFKI